MPLSPLSRRWRSLVLALAVVALAGCASTAIDDNFTSSQRVARERLGAELRWLRSDDARQQAEADVDALLSRPLGADDAVRIGLSYSPALQAVLFDSAAESADATRSARLPNPVLSFERLSRQEDGVPHLEISRLLTLPVLDLLLLPARMRLADHRQQAIRLRQATDVARTAHEVRSAWVRAVAARQSLQYVEQVKAAADASAELARRMEAAGNFSKLQRAREQAFSADAVAQLARARREVQATREALVRRLGLDGARAARLQLPDRLPDLPATPCGEQPTLQSALDGRLDVALAKAELEFSARQNGLNRVTGVIDGLDLGVVRNSETGLPPQRGYELSLPLPVFDAGGAARAGAQARYMAALNRTAAIAAEAGSQVREAHGAYQAAYDLARHYRDEIVPLRKSIAEQNLLRYNGMLIGVFELLADAREQIGSVVQAIDAQRDFWLADAALQAALIGAPSDMPSSTTRPVAAD